MDCPNCGAALPLLWRGDLEIYGSCLACHYLSLAATMFDAIREAALDEAALGDPVVARAEALGYTVEIRKRKYGKWYVLSRDRHPEYDDVRGYAEQVLASMQTSCFGPK